MILGMSLATFTMVQHATAHFHATGHPVIEGYDPPEGWGWCYVDEVLFDLSKRKTPHNGPIPRYY